ncbi:hypothetical protein [Chachezhania sediminis]|uniref:hypothetical protein n=1 Tax=Chachezhania sediminis TaxID=2599291 RepID=UPI00131E0A62|nr:hypothetical protein [Chachezhania sediminis]
MRRILILLALVLTAWASLPDKAPAHGVDHDMAMTGDMVTDCPGCTGLGDDHVAADCAHLACCATSALSTALQGTATRPATALAFRPDLRKAFHPTVLLSDPPPPRS